MTRLRRISAVLAVSLLVMCISPVGALAAVADNPTVEVQFWPDGQPGYSLLIVTVELPSDTVLPIDVRLPIPEGSDVVWSGEIMGGASIEADIPRDYRLVDGEAGPALEMTLETTLTAQYEAVYLPLANNGAEISTSLDWLQSVPSEDVFFSIRVPATAIDVRIDPAVSGIPQTNDVGERLYTIAPQAIAVGDHFNVDVAYRLAGAGVTNGSNGGSPSLLTIFIVLFAVMAVVLVIALGRQKRHEVSDHFEE